MLLMTSELLPGCSDVSQLWINSRCPRNKGTFSAKCPFPFRENSIPRPRDFEQTAPTGQLQIRSEQAGMGLSVTWLRIRYSYNSSKHCDLYPNVHPRLRQPLSRSPKKVQHVPLSVTSSRSANEASSMVRVYITTLAL